MYIEGICLPVVHIVTCILKMYWAVKITIAYSLHCLNLYITHCLVYMRKYVLCARACPLQCSLHTTLKHLLVLLFFSF